MKKYIIGDVHGCFRTLQGLLSKLPKDANASNIVFLGDLIDRGPENRKVINFVRDGGYDCVKGNHEDLMIRDLFNTREYNSPIHMGAWCVNGGDKTLQEYNTPDELQADVDYLDGLPSHLIFDIEDNLKRKLLCSHAPSLDFKDAFIDIPEKHIHKRVLSNIMWNRNIPYDEQTEYFNVFGHNIIDSFIFNQEGNLKIPAGNITPEGTIYDIKRGYAGIDTGGFIQEQTKYHGRLTCLEFPSMKIYQQDNIELNQPSN